MTNPEELLELAERVEAAGAADIPEMTAELGRLLGWRNVNFVTGYPRPLGWAPDDKLETVLPLWLTSLDAALTLVPDGTELVTICVVNREGYLPSAGVDAGRFISHAATPALALTAAALRARASTKEPTP